MLIAFVIRDESDWKNWRQSVSQTPGKPIIHVADKETTLSGHGSERESAVDEVEILDDDDEDDIVTISGSDIRDDKF